MSIVIPSLRAAVAVPGWAKNVLWRNARAVPSLDLRFADNKSLTDAITGASLVTFTRASSGTYVDSAGVLQTAAIGVPRFDHSITSSTTNLLLRSEEFDNASWIKWNSTITANAAIAPNGTLTADKLVENTANDQHIIYQSLSGTGRILSFYAKAAERTWVTIWGSGGGISRVDLTTGATGTVAPGATIVTQNVGDGWYRISVTDTNASFQVIGVAQSNATISYTGDGTSGIYLWGAQLEQSATVGPYVPTTTAAATSNTTESLGLLVEEARTNLVLRSEEFDNAGAWTKVGVTVSANSITSPDGALTADTLVEDTSTGTHRCVAAPTIANTTVYTVSVYAKAAGRTHMRVSLSGGLAGELTANLSNGTVAASSGATNPTVQSVGNDWYRVSFTTAASTSTSAQITFACIQGTSTSSYTGDGTSGTALCGAQLEAGAFPTSYILTTTATATRSADVASITGTAFSGWYRQDKGTVFTEGNSYGFSASNFPTFASISDGTLDNRLQYAYITSGLGGYLVASGGANVVQLYPGIAINPRRAAFAAAANNYAVSFNGASPAVDTAGNMPIGVNQMQIGNLLGAGATSNFFGTIKRITYWPQALPSRLQALTQ